MAEHPQTIDVPPSICEPPRSIRIAMTETFLRGLIGDLEIALNRLDADPQTRAGAATDTRTRLDALVVLFQGRNDSLKDLTLLRVRRACGDDGSRSEDELIRYISYLRHIALETRTAPVGTVVQAGTDSTGQPSVRVHTSEDELTRGYSMLYRQVALVPTSRLTLAQALTGYDDEEGDNE